MDRTRRNILIGGSLVGAMAVGGLLPAMCARQQIKKGMPMPSGDPPARPHGQPEPLIDEDIAPVLARLDAWYAAHLSPEKYVLNPPATDAQIDEFEELVGLKLPRSYRALYRWHDGEEDDRWGHIYGLPLVSLRRAASDWTSWNEIIASFGGNRYMIPAASWPRARSIRLTSIRAGFLSLWTVRAIISGWTSIPGPVAASAKSFSTAAMKT